MTEQGARRGLAPVLIVVPSLISGVGLVCILVSYLSNNQIVTDVFFVLGASLLFLDFFVTMAIFRYTVRNIDRRLRRIEGALGSGEKASAKAAAPTASTPNMPSRPNTTLARGVSREVTPAAMAASIAGAVPSNRSTTTAPDAASPNSPKARARACRSPTLCARPDTPSAPSSSAPGAWFEKYRDRAKARPTEGPPEERIHASAAV
jgi:hypothetical protein